MQTCGFCGQPFPLSQAHCPHCGRPSLFPNVAVAEQPEERRALAARYEAARNRLSARGCDSVREDFEKAIRSDAVAVVCMGIHEVFDLANADTNVVPTYYRRVAAGAIIPKGGKWDIIRPVCEEATLPGFKDDVRFAALSLDGVGVRNYGECSVVLKTSMICHRTSLYEDNNVVFTAFRQGITMAEADKLPEGYRATWAESEKLCVAKLADCLEVGLTTSDFPRILLEHGRTREDDKFVELHIWGSLTVRSFEKVLVLRKNNRPVRAVLRDLERLLRVYSVSLELGPWKP